MKKFIDIETIPDQTPGAIDEIAKTITVKCPHTTKDAIGKHLGMDAADIKSVSAPEIKEIWIERFGKSEALIQAEEQWRKTSFDGGKGEIISVAFSDENGNVEAVSRNDGDEKKMLALLFAFLKPSNTARPPLFVGHNVRFDLKFLYRRCVVLGIKPPVKIPFYGRHGSDFYCTSEAWAGYNERISQNDLCGILGIDGKPDDIDGSKVWDFYKDGKLDRIVEYNKDDVEKCRAIYQRLNFIS